MVNFNGCNRKLNEFSSSKYTEITMDKKECSWLAISCCKQSELTRICYLHFRFLNSHVQNHVLVLKVHQRIRITLKKCEISIINMRFLFKKKKWWGVEKRLWQIFIFLNITFKELRDHFQIILSVWTSFCKYSPRPST